MSVCSLLSALILNAWQVAVIYWLIKNWFNIPNVLLAICLLKRVWGDDKRHFEKTAVTNPTISQKNLVVNFADFEVYVFAELLWGDAIEWKQISDSRLNCRNISSFIYQLYWKEKPFQCKWDDILESLFIKMCLNALILLSRWL